MITGWIDLGGSSQDLVGSLSWLRPPTTRTRLFQNGFAIGSTVVGSSYVPPKRGDTVLNPGTALLTLQGGGLAQPLTNLVALVSNRQILNLGPNRLSLSISFPSGIFTGRVVDRLSSRTLTFGGVVLQAQNTGAGFFLDQGQSGSVVLQGP